QQEILQLIEELKSPLAPASIGINLRNYGNDYGSQAVQALADAFEKTEDDNFRTKIVEVLNTIQNASAKDVLGRLNASPVYNVYTLGSHTIRKLLDIFGQYPGTIWNHELEDTFQISRVALVRASEEDLHILALVAASEAT